MFIKKWVNMTHFHQLEKEAKSLERDRVKKTRRHFSTRDSSSRVFLFLFLVAVFFPSIWLQAFQTDPQAGRRLFRSYTYPPRASTLCLLHIGLHRQEKTQGERAFPLFYTSQFLSGHA